MASALTQSGFSNQLTEAMRSLPDGNPTFLTASILAFIVLGSALEGIPAIVLLNAERACRVRDERCMERIDTRALNLTTGWAAYRPVR